MPNLIPSRLLQFMFPYEVAERLVAGAVGAEVTINVIETPAPVVEVAPYRLATPTRIQFAGSVDCYTAPDFGARKLTFTDNREVDILEERGDWWCVYRTTLKPSGKLFELWVVAAWFACRRSG